MLIVSILFFPFYLPCTLLNTHKAPHLFQCEAFHTFQIVTLNPGLSVTGRLEFHNSWINFRVVCKAILKTIIGNCKYFGNFFSCIYGNCFLTSLKQLKIKPCKYTQKQSKHYLIQ